MTTGNLGPGWKQSNYTNWNDSEFSPGSREAKSAIQSSGNVTAVMVCMILFIGFAIGAVWLHAHDWILHTRTCGSVATHDPLLCWCTLTCQHLVSKVEVIDYILFILTIVFALLFVWNVVNLRQTGRHGGGGVTAAASQPSVSPSTPGPPTAPPPGWYPEPSAPSGLRWWDGEVWGPAVPPTSNQPPA